MAQPDSLSGPGCCHALSMMKILSYLIFLSEQTRTSEFLLAALAPDNVANWRILDLDPDGIGTRPDG
jgi:hypothetical protein